LFGGGVAGLLWYLNNTLSTKFVSQLSRNEAIFGPLAAIPVFMVGLYFFWMLLLFGAQVAYTYQNRFSLLVFRQTDRVHQAGRELVALRIMLEAARAFATAGTAPTTALLSQRLEVPGELIGRLTRILLQARLLVEAGQAETGFLPARPLEAITVAQVLDAMRRGVGGGLPTRAGPEREVVERQLSEVLGAERAAGNRTLAELVRGVA
jgi:membrane protein